MPARKAVLLAGLFFTCLAVCARAQVVKVGSKNFTEQFIVAEIYTQALEQAGIAARARTNLGATLMVLALMMPVLGIGLWPSIVALTVLAIPPILLNAHVGLRDVDPDAVEAATGMGMSRGQVLRTIRVSLAAPALSAGVRTATVQVLAGATLAPFIGGGGLGDFIATGISMMDTSRMLVGAVPIALLALGAELVLGLAQRALFSEKRWSGRRAAG